MQVPFSNAIVTTIASPTETTTNVYDEARGGYSNLGKLTSATRTVPVNGSIPAVSVARQYDYELMGHEARETHLAINGASPGADRMLAFEYWPDGSLKRKQMGDGTWTGQYVYDFAGRLSAIANAATPSASEPPSFVASAQYNARGQTVSIAYGNGAASAYTYNDARGFLTHVLTVNGAATLIDQSYTRNPRGQIVSIASPQAGKSWAYGYDALDRLITAANSNTPAESRTYAYDDADNMIYNSGLCAGSASAPNMVYPAQGSTSPNHPHAPTSICGTSVTYDANGNTLSYDANGNTLSYDVDGAAGPILPRSLTYDGENRPISVTQNANQSSFAYGPDGERALKSFGTSTSYYMGAEAELLVDSANPTGLLTSYLHADVKRQGTATDFSFKDHLASNRTVQRFAPTSTQATDYGPFGQPLTSNGSTPINGGHSFCYGVFDLHTRVHFNEVELARIHNHQELDSARAFIPRIHNEHGRKSCVPTRKLRRVGHR